MDICKSICKIKSNGDKLTGKCNDESYELITEPVKKNIIEEKKDHKELFVSINPFETLGIKEEECKKMNPNVLFNFNQDLITDKYKEMKSIGKNNEKLLLSYFILFNLKRFKRIGDNFIIEQTDHFYYVVMNDFNNLKKIYEKNKYILFQKDDFNRTLLHLSAIGENYEITKFLLEKGINYDEPDTFHRTALYYAKGNLEALLKSYNAYNIIYNSGMVPRGINMDEKDINKIDLISKLFLKREIITKIELIKNKGEIVGQRLIRNKNREKLGFYGRYQESTKEWIPVYHGTKFVAIEHILLYGLHYYGEPS